MGFMWLMWLNILTSQKTDELDRVSRDHLIMLLGSNFTEVSMYIVMLIAMSALEGNNY